MIENTRKILKKLIDNIDKYHVSISKFSYQIGVGSPKITEEYIIHYINNDIIYRISVTDAYILWSTGDKIHNLGCELRTELDEQFRYEILDLCVRLKNRCEDYTSTMFRKFADESDNEPDDDLE